MHECPDCGQACACDQEDVWNDFASDDCEHRCAPGFDDDDDDLTYCDLCGLAWAYCRCDA